MIGYPWEASPIELQVNASENLPADVSQNWCSGVRENIREQEYHISLQKDGEGYQAPNRAQNLRTWFTSKGIKVVNRIQTAAIAYIAGRQQEGWSQSETVAMSSPCPSNNAVVSRMPRAMPPLGTTSKWCSGQLPI